MYAWRHLHVSQNSINFVLHIVFSPFFKFSAENAIFLVSFLGVRKFTNFDIYTYELALMISFMDPEIVYLESSNVARDLSSEYIWIYKYF